MNQSTKKPVNQYDLPKVEIEVAETAETVVAAPAPMPPVTMPKVTTKIVNQAQRRRLPDDRQALIHKFCINGQEGYITVGLYDDGRPGEVFIRLAQSGTPLEGLLNSLAVTLSVSLQYGVPLEVLAQKMLHMSYQPAGATTNPTIPQAESISDYLARWLAWKFLSPDQQRSLGLPAAKVTSDQLHLPNQ